MHGTLTGLRVPGAAQRLAIQDDNFLRGMDRQCLDLGLEPCFELVGINPAKDPAKRVMRRNAVRQSCLIWPHCSTFTHESAPLITAQSTMVRISRRSCRLVRATRGPTRSAKQLALPWRLVIVAIVLFRT